MEDLVFVHQMYDTGETVVKCAKLVKKVEIEFYTDSSMVKRIEVERKANSYENITPPTQKRVVQND